jgi:hypothetical protein
VVEKIRSYSREQPVYIAYDGNGWCINPHNVAKKLIRDGANFRATGLATEDFNIFQLPDGKYPKDYENGINWLFLNKIKEYQWVKCDKPERTGCVIEAQ